MKIRNVEFRKPWARYVDIDIEAELYLAVRRSVLEDLLAEVDAAAQRVYENDIATTKERSGSEPYRGDAYCVKCKENRNFEGVIKISDSGRRMAQGKCPICNTKLNRILGKA